MKKKNFATSVLASVLLAATPATAFGQDEDPPEPPNGSTCNGVTCETLICDPQTYMCDTYTYPDPAGQAPPDDNP